MYCATWRSTKHDQGVLVVHALCITRSCAVDAATDVASYKDISFSAVRGCSCDRCQPWGIWLMSMNMISQM